MNEIRAKEIIESVEEIDVTYQGESVWLNDINSNNDTAIVQKPVKSNNTVEVPLSELVEKR